MQLSPLAQRVLSDHHRAPTAFFYDLFSLGGMFRESAIDHLDAAYKELVSQGMIERSNDRTVQLFGIVRPAYRLANGASVTEVAS